MNQVDAGAGGRAREPDECPSEVGGRVRRSFDMRDTERKKAGIAAERYQSRRVVECQERRTEVADISADTGGGRGEGETVYANAQTSHWK